MKVQGARSLGYYFEKAVKLATLGIVGFVVVDNHKHTIINLEKCKQEICQRDSVRYNNFNSFYKPRNRYSDYKAWGLERDRMYDSIKKQGESNKAYFEGINNIKQ